MWTLDGPERVVAKQEMRAMIVRKRDTQAAKDLKQIKDYNFKRKLNSPPSFMYCDGSPTADRTNGTMNYYISYVQDTPCNLMSPVDLFNEWRR